MGHWAQHKFPATMRAMSLPPDAEVVVNRLGESFSAHCRPVLLVRTARVEVEVNSDAMARLFWIHGFALHGDGKRSYTFELRKAPHVRGVLAIVAGVKAEGGNDEERSHLGAFCIDFSRCRVIVGGGAD